MASLRDQSFNREAWLKLGFILMAGGVAALLIFFSVQAHHNYIEIPRLLSARHDEQVGFPGRVTTSIMQLGPEAVPTLITDLAVGVDSALRRKSIEMISGISDPRVLPALIAVLYDEDVGVRMAAISGMVRLGDPGAAASLWKALETADDWFSQRVIVAIGLVGGPAEVEPCLSRANKTTGQRRHLFAWSAGQLQRRQTERDQIGRVPPAPVPEDYDHEGRIQGQVDAALAELDAADVTAERALAFAQLTAVEYGTWNQGHQISYQTIAVNGPRVLRGIGKIDGVPKPVFVVRDKADPSVNGATLPIPEKAPTQPQAQ
jgi:hypothetical protein